MRSVRQAVASLIRGLDPEADSKPVPDGVCPDCLEEHACQACHDQGRACTTGDPFAPEFGHSAPCPECSGTSSGVGDPDEWRRRSGVPRGLQAQRIETFEPADAEARQFAEQYVEWWPPAQPFVLLAGSVGTGKTHLAVGISYAVWRRHGKPSRFVRVVDLLDRLKATFDLEDDERREAQRTITAEMERVPLLALDDLGAQKATEWADERLYAIIDRRYADRLATVITTNVDIERMEPRLRSRIGDRGTTVRILLDGPDYRDTKGSKHA